MPVPFFSALIKAQDGGISAQYEYAAFGETLRATGTMAQENPLRFSSKCTDPENGLEYYGYRYYNSTIGRWISRDTINESGGINILSFANNDEVNHTDAVGLMTEDQVFKRALDINNAVKNIACKCESQDGADIKNFSIYGSAEGWEVTNGINVKAGDAVLQILEVYWWDCFTAQSEAKAAAAGIAILPPTGWRKYGWELGGLTITAYHGGTYIPAWSSIDPSDASHWNWDAMMIYLVCRGGHLHANIAISSNQLNYNAAKFWNEWQGPASNTIDTIPRGQ